MNKNAELSILIELRVIYFLNFRTMFVELANICRHVGAGFT